VPRWAWGLCAAVVLLAGVVALRLGERRFAGEDTWTGVDRIVAVGDVHGDFEQFVKALRAAQVINEKNDWIGGKTHLVQTGDVLDRGPDSRKAMDLLMKLEEEAPKAGGMVHALIGNHEAMVLLGSWGYVSAGEKKAFGGAKAYREAMSAEGKYGRWIRSHNAVIKINDLVFVHAGIMWAFARQSLAEINEAVRRNCPAIIVLHNHPSGDVSPSPEDVMVTKQIVEAGKLMDVEVLDHLILGRNRYVSMKERGLGFA